MESAKKVCLYDRLKITKDATDADIKNAYRRQAMQYHPDKAPVGKAEEYKAQFQLILEAYNILKDKNERAWYDSHKEKFLNPDFNPEEFNGFNFNIEDFISEKAYDSSTDSKSFYQVYNDVFMKIKIEEENAVNNLDDKEFEQKEGLYLNAPNFGDNESSDADVEAFYSYWENFNTVKGFDWADPFDVREADSRRLKRLIEQENKRFRTKARKHYLSIVKRLVTFVKARDERYNKLIKKREAEKAAKQRELEAEKQRKAEEWKLKKQKLLEEEIQRYEEEAAERQESELEQAIKYDMRKLQEEEVFESFDCEICDKTFKSKNQLDNHCKSKDHIKKKKKLLKEVALDDEQHHIEELDEELKTFNNGVKKKKKKKKKNAMKTVFSTNLDEEPVKPELAPEEPAQELITEDPTPEDILDKKAKKKLKREKKKAKKEKNERMCKLCQTLFESKTKLHTHLRVDHNYK